MPRTSSSQSTSCLVFAGPGARRAPQPEQLWNCSGETLDIEIHAVAKATTDDWLRDQGKATAFEQVDGRTEVQIGTIGSDIKGVEMVRGVVGHRLLHSAAL